VRAEAGAGGGGEGLYCVALVEQSLVIELFEQIPEGLYIPVVIGDVGVVHVDPVPHVACQILPCIGVLHHVLAAGLVVLVDRDLRADILLGYAEGFLHAEFYGQAVGVPSGLAFDLVALHRAEAADGVLDGARHDMVDSGHPVGRGGTLEEDEFALAVATAQRLPESIMLVPHFEHRVAQVSGGQAPYIREISSTYNLFFSGCKVSEIRKGVVLY
jgi:hypothetical protein